MKKLILILFFQFAVIIASNAQCNTQIVNRPDGITMEYFNPKGVIRTSEYEVGASIYKNRNTGDLLLNISVLFKTLSPQKLTGDLIVHTTSSSGISLSPVLSELIKMNGRDVALGLYLISQRDYEILKSSKLKGIYFSVGGSLKGDSVTENAYLLKEQLKCLKF